MDMVEKVAKAISMSRHGGYEAYAENRQTDPKWWQALRDARAAIEAMKEPTPQMERALSRSAWQSGSGRLPADVIADVIDTALSPA